MPHALLQLVRNFTFISFDRSFTAYLCRPLMRGSFCHVPHPHSKEGSQMDRWPSRQRHPPAVLNFFKSLALYGVLGSPGSEGACSRAQRPTSSFGKRSLHTPTPIRRRRVKFAPLTVFLMKRRSLLKANSLS